MAKRIEGILCMRICELKKKREPVKSVLGKKGEMMRSRKGKKGRRDEAKDRKREAGIVLSYRR